MAILGVDIGTTAVKAMVIEPGTGRRWLSQRGLGIMTPGSGLVEQDPEDYWLATRAAVADVIEKAGAGVRVGSLSVSSQGGTLIPLDAHGKALGNAVVWMDHRASKQSEEMLDRLGGDYFYLRSGWRPSGCLPFLQIRWLKEERPELFAKVDRFSFVGDYVQERLSGEWATDPTSAGMTMLYNLGGDCWDPELVELAGIGAEMLPDLRPAGEGLGDLDPQAARELGLPGRTPVVNGGHDQYCASLGAGAIGEGHMLISGGTAWVLLATCPHACFDTSTYLSPGRHIMQGMWGLLSSIPTAGAGLNWFRALAGRGRRESEFYDGIETRAQKVPVGSEGLLFYPYFAGSTAPTWEPRLRGAILGMNLGHQLHHIFRAYLEGVAFECRLNVDSYRDLGVEVRSAVMIGGASRSAIWTRILADVLGIPLRVPEVQEAACLGAAIIAGKGSGIFGGFGEGVRRMVRDRETIAPAADRSAYERAFERYRDSFGALRQSGR